MYSLPKRRSSKERGALPRRKPCISTFCTSLRYALSEAFSSSSQVTSTLRTASLPGNFSTETFTFPPRSMKTNQRMLFMIKYRDLHTLPCILISREQSQLSWEAQRGNHHPTPGRELERETGIEPATFSLARRCSTTEPLPHYTCICMIKISYWKGFVNWFLKKITLPRSLDPSIILLHAPGHGMVPAPGGLAGLPRYPAGAAILHRPGGLVTPRPGDRGEEPALPGCLVAHHSLHPTI